uniref:Large ribosomal subunit protein bL28c n=1 Tax=Hildenbrandia rivularis TaxID=135206 RepID=A0A1C9CFE9_9FLOR|nr:ribosomal protein L28 [Hildenbrandia rivularis]AOM67111.1 ribosomal protein L28 [Hildenbrandia rivularis]
MPKICQITNKRANNGHTISHSHKISKKVQKANLQKKKVWCQKKRQYIRLLICTKAIKTLIKHNISMHYNMIISDKL